MQGINQFTEAFRTVVKTLPLFWEASKMKTVILFLIVPVQGILPAFSLWLSRELINYLPNSSNGVNTIILTLFITWLIVVFFQSILRPLEMTIQGLMTDQMIASINKNLMKKSADLYGLYYFEEAKFYDDIQVLESEAAWRPVNLIVFMMGILRNVTTCFSMLILLGSFEIWIPILILASILPQSLIVYRLQREAFETLVVNSPESRRMNYYSSIMLSNHYAKEVKLFNLGSYFINKYQKAFNQIHNSVKTVRYRQFSLSLVFIILGTAGIGISLFWVLNQAIVGTITPGDILIFTSSILLARESLSGMIEESSLLYDTTLYMKKYFSFLELSSDVTSGRLPVKLDSSQSFLIKFDDVSFKYPNEERQVLKSFNLTIHSGERIALIGENGAGKTTLIKLLMRFYTPDSGRILLNDMDIQDLDIHSYRDLITTIFQDYNQYQLTFEENIMISDVYKENDQERLRQSIEFAGLNSLVEKFNNHLDKILSKNYEDGTELSGGQWQKMSIARAFYRDSPVMIFDEPSASLDSKAEDEFIRKLRHLSKDKTVLLITHRLSALSVADKIVHIENGQVNEEGSLKELINKKDGRVAELFELQASKYKV